MAAITVAQLAALLAEMPQDAIVVLSKDAEGNRFSPVDAQQACTLGAYEAVNPWSGFFRGDDGDDVTTRGVPAVVLWPTN